MLVSNWLVLTVYFQSSNEEDKLSKVERELAKLRKKLVKEFGNSQNDLLYYTCPVTADNVALTPAMVNEWIWAVVCVSVSLM